MSTLLEAACHHNDALQIFATNFDLARFSRDAC